jgi:hypothetical protein
MSRLAAARPAARRIWVGPLCASISLTLSVLAAEFGFRALAGPLGIEPRVLAEARDVVLCQRASHYEPKPYYGWSLAQSTRGPNRYGFYGDDWALERKSGVLRIACLGGSTTAGGNPKGYFGSYPYHLRELLRQQLGREIEVMNCGISGWTTAEITCAWFLLIQDFQPDLVILHEVVNDLEPRSFPGFRPDYVHWRSAWRVPPTPPATRWLVGHSDLLAWVHSRTPPPTLTTATVNALEGAHTFRDGRFPPETVAPFRRNVSTIGTSVEGLGGTVLLATLPPRPREKGKPDAGQTRAGIAEHNQLFRELAKARGWMLADLETLAAGDPAATRSHFLDLVHVDSEANAWKAACIAHVLAREWKPLIEQLAAKPH